MTTDNQSYTFRCMRCGFVWRRSSSQGKPDIKTCPKCSSPEWNKSRSAPGKP